MENFGQHPPAEDAASAEETQPSNPGGDARAEALSDEAASKTARTLRSRMSSVIPSGNRFAYSVMKKKDCLLDIQNIRNKIGAAADKAIPEAIADAISKNAQLLRAIATNDAAKSVLGIDQDAAQRLIERANAMGEAEEHAGGRKRRKSRKMKKSRKPKRGKKSNKRKRTRKH